MRHLRCDFQLLTFVFSLVGGLLGFAASAAAADWHEGRPMTTARAHAGGVLVGEDIYVIGGSSTSGPRSLTEVYDTLGNIWRAAAPMSVGLEQFGIATDGMKIFVAGGYETIGADRNDDAETDALWIYDVRSGNWTAGPDMPDWRVGLSLAVVGDKIYALGGRGTSTQQIFVFDIGGQEWSISKSSNPAPRFDSAVVVVDGLIYVIGGKEGTRASSRVDIFDPAKGTWSRGPALPEPREGHSAAVFEGKIHVIGGQVIRPPKTFVDHFVFDLKSKSWSKAAPMPTPRHAAIAAASKDKFIVLGGASGAGVYTVFTSSDLVDIYTGP
jgi:N-acetylneuraminic acid mutarotase